MAAPVAEKLVAIDPAAKTGWAVISGGVIDSGVIPFSDAGPFIDAHRDATHLAVEDGYVDLSGRGRRKPNIEQYGKHCKKVGGVVMAMSQVASLSQVWVPKPSQWRAILRGAGVKMAQNPREQCKADALAFARLLGRECRGPRGGNLEDEADAVCLAVAAALKWGVEIEFFRR